jgi:hypothetical protein
MDGEGIQARLCANNGKRFLWIINHGLNCQQACVRIDGVQSIDHIFWGDSDGVSVKNDIITAEVPGKDAVVVSIY